MSGLPFSFHVQRRAMYYLPGGAMQCWALHYLSGGALAAALRWADVVPPWALLHLSGGAPGAAGRQARLAACAVMCSGVHTLQCSVFSCTAEYTPPLCSQGGIHDLNSQQPDSMLKLNSKHTILN